MQKGAGAGKVASKVKEQTAKLKASLRGSQRIVLEVSSSFAKNPSCSVSGRAGRQ